MTFKLSALSTAATCVATIAFSGVASAGTFGNAYSSDIIYFGTPDTTSYGETFVSPGGTLSSWSFWTDGATVDQNGTIVGNGNLELVVAGWDGTKAIGPALYTSTAQYNSGALNTEFTFSGIDLATTAGDSYIAYLTIAGVTDPTSGVPVEGSATNGGLGGAFFYLNTNGVDPLVSPSDWSGYKIPDMRFSAEFSQSQQAPEPITLSVFGAGLAGAVLFSKRRRKSTAT